MDFRVLGPLEVEGRQGLVQITGAKERALLALLLVRANRLVSRDVLIDELWGEHPPETARHTLEGYVSRLRRAFAVGGNESVIESQASGYRVRVGDDELDALRFERLLEEGGSELENGALERAEERLAAALGLWRGPALADLADEPFAEVEALRLEELRMAGVEARLDVALRLGRDAELVGELQSLVAANPLRERLRAELMLALYRAGRQADALAVYRDGRRRLDELGIEPGRELQELEQAILRHDQALESQAVVSESQAERVPDQGLAPTTPPAAAPERRKIVTVVFCDVMDSIGADERVDPEVLKGLLDGSFGRMKEIMEFHGGTVERGTGNAVVAVFGVPFVHEDDALRACRAAAEIQDALPELGLQGRIGVGSGEVVTDASERLVIGVAVEVAARLQQAAEPGEVLIGQLSLELARSVEVTPVDPLSAVDAEPVQAYRLLSVTEAEVSALSAESRFVGRVPELTLLREAWERVLAEQRCELVTIVGEAGIGKSRLVAEAISSLEARVVQSRCLPYGNGITYWPATEVVKQLDAKPSDPFAAAAIRSLLGETDEGTSAEEIAWAFRKLLEQEAPLVVVFDDLHRAEETFLDLVEAIALLSSGAPLLIVCVARPELRTKRPDWPVTVSLDPLTDDQVTELIDNRVSAEVGERVARAAGGSPLFVVELLAMAEQSGDVDVPATLQALLAARLEQLEESDRQVLEHAAVEGEVFHRGAVQALTPDDPRLMRRLTVLARGGLIRPDKAQIAGEDGFRFSHVLLRDAAYEAIPKPVRAAMHEQFAGWLGARGGLVELDELLGYHLEQALRYRGELSLPIDSELQDAARHHLIAAGRTAYTREDFAAAVSLLERAITLRPEPPDVGLELEFLEALAGVGRLADARADADALAKRAATVGDSVGALAAQIEAGWLRIRLEPEEATGELATLLEQALPQLEADGDDRLLCHAYVALGNVCNMRVQYDRAAEAYERAAAHAARAGLPYTFTGEQAGFRLWGSWPITRWLAWYDEQKDKANSGLRIRHALALGLLGRIDDAREELADVRADRADRGAGLAGVSQNALVLERYGGDLELALSAGRASCEELERLGEKPVLSSLCALLAQACYETGRLEEVEDWATRAAALGPDDAWTQIDSRLARAKLLARQGHAADARRLACAAVAIADTTEAPVMQANAYADLAEVLTLAGKTEPARAALDEALTRYEHKEAIVLAQQIRDRLTALDVTRQPATVEA